MSNLMEQQSTGGGGVVWGGVVGWAVVTWVVISAEVRDVSVLVSAPFHSEVREVGGGGNPSLALLIDFPKYRTVIMAANATVTKMAVPRFIYLLYNPPTQFLEWAVTRDVTRWNLPAY